MEEAEHFDWLMAMDAGKIIGTGSAAELKTQTNSQTLRKPLSLLPPERQQGHHALVIPPRDINNHQWAIEAQGLTQRFGDFTAVDNAAVCHR